jgi:flavin reductase (DIM6/NTAB) family NADH-FMN oxidoreductase RutF
VPIDADLFRKLMGNFATGVTVVTTAVDDRLHGFTANAVTSVSLDPLLLLVCVDKRAHAHGELQQARSFGVNVLASSQAGISDIFAKSGAPVEGSLRGVEFRVGKTGSPLIEGCLAWLECAVHDLVEGGDHTIVVGRVVAGTLGGADPPLIFFRGRYCRLTD